MSELDGILAGVILGDGNLTINPKGKNAYLQMHHSVEQEAYLRHKVELLSKLTKVSMSRYGHCVRAWSKCIPYLTKFYRLAYPRGKKEINRKLLSKLTPQGIAIWYMDDGSIREKVKNGAVRGRDIRLYTCSFTEAENKEIIQYFSQVWDIWWNLRNIRQHNKTYKYLGCGANEGRKLFSLISPYVIDSMKYKITFSPNKLRSNVQHPLAGMVIQSGLHGNVKNAAEMPASI